MHSNFGAVVCEANGVDQFAEGLEDCLRQVPRTLEEEVASMLEASWEKGRKPVILSRSMNIRGLKIEIVNKCERSWQLNVYQTVRGQWSLMKGYAFKPICPAQWRKACVNAAGAVIAHGSKAPREFNRAFASKRA